MKSERSFPCATIGFGLQRVDAFKGTVAEKYRDAAVQYQRYAKLAGMRKLRSNSQKILWGCHQIRINSRTRRRSKKRTAPCKP
jgi:hypothetical protein